MALNPTLERFNVFGFALQSAQGTPASTGFNWIPMRAETNIERNPNLEAVDQADGVGYDQLMYSKGIWIEGAAGVSTQPVSPSILDLVTWIITRDSYGQGAFATVVMKNARRTDAYQDVKVGSAVFRMHSGAPLETELHLHGVAPSTGGAPTVGSVQAGAPYIFDEVTVGVDWDGSGSVGSAEMTIKTFEINIDNLLQTGEEGLRLGSLYMQSLYNNGDPLITGSFTRDYVDSTTESQDPFDLWLQQIANLNNASYKAKMSISMTRGSVTLSFVMGNIWFKKVGQPAKGTRRGTMTQTIEYLALADTTLTPPVGLVLTG